MRMPRYPCAVAEYSSIPMALYMDRHDLPGATAADIATAHLRDLEVQERFGVRFVTYWVRRRGRQRILPH